jgi:hypothetical protein
MRRKQTGFDKFQSQLKLPYLSTDYRLIPEIFKVIESNFGLERNSRQKFVDLGAGDGSIVMYVALNYNIRSFGIEIDQNLVDEALRKKKLFKSEENYTKRQKKKIKLYFGDFYRLNLKKYDFIYIYSLPSMQKFLIHIFRTVTNRSIVISHKYPLTPLTSILKEEYILTQKCNDLELHTYYYKKIL